MSRPPVNLIPSPWKSWIQASRMLSMKIISPVSAPRAQARRGGASVGMKPVALRMASRKVAVKAAATEKRSIGEHQYIENEKVPDSLLRPGRCILNPIST